MDRVDEQPITSANTNANPVTNAAIQNGPKNPIGEINKALMDGFGAKIGDLNEEQLKEITNKLDINLSIGENKNHLMKEIYLKQFANATDPKKKDAPYLIDCTNKTTMKTNQCKDDGSTDVGNAKSTSNIINSNIKNALNNSDFTNKNIFFPEIDISTSGSPDKLNARQTPEKTGFMYFKKDGESSTPTAFRYYDELLILPPQVYLYMAAKSLGEMTIEFDANEFKTSDGSVVVKSTNPLGNFSIKLTKDDATKSYKQSITKVEGQGTTAHQPKSLFSPIIDKNFMDKVNNTTSIKSTTAPKESSTSSSESSSSSVSNTIKTGFAAIGSITDYSSRIKENIMEWKTVFEEKINSGGTNEIEMKKLLDKAGISFTADKHLSLNDSNDPNLKIEDILNLNNMEYKLRLIVLAISHSIYMQHKDGIHGELIPQIKKIKFAYDDVKGTLSGGLSYFLTIVENINRIHFEKHGEILKETDVEEVKNKISTKAENDNEKEKEVRGMKYLDALIKLMQSCYHIGDKDSDYHKGINLRKNCTRLNNEHKLFNELSKGLTGKDRELKLQALHRVAALFLDLYRSLIPGISPESDKKNEYYFQENEKKSMITKVGNAFGNLWTGTNDTDKLIEDHAEYREHGLKAIEDKKEPVPVPEPVAADNKIDNSYLINNIEKFIKDTLKTAKIMFSSKDGVCTVEYPTQNVKGEETIPGEDEFKYDDDEKKKIVRMYFKLLYEKGGSNKLTTIDMIRDGTYIVNAKDSTANLSDVDIKNLLEKKIGDTDDDKQFIELCKFIFDWSPAFKSDDLLQHSGYNMGMFKNYHNDFIKEFEKSSDTFNVFIQSITETKPEIKKLADRLDIILKALSIIYSESIVVKVGGDYKIVNLTDLQKDSLCIIYGNKKEDLGTGKCDKILDLSKIQKENYSRGNANEFKSNPTKRTFEEGTYMKKTFETFEFVAIDYLQLDRPYLIYNRGDLGGGLFGDGTLVADEGYNKKSKKLVIYQDGYVYLREGIHLQDSVISTSVKFIPAEILTKANLRGETNTTIGDGNKDSTVIMNYNKRDNVEPIKVFREEQPMDPYLLIKGGKLSRKKSKTQKKLRFQKRNKTNKRKMSIKHKKRIQVKKGHKKTSKK